MEKWQDIPGYEGIYQVNSDMNVRSLKFGKTKIMKTLRDKNGNPIIQLSYKGVKKSVRLDKIMASRVEIEYSPRKLTTINNYRTTIEKVVRKFIKQREDREDATQDIIYEILKNEDYFKESSHLVYQIDTAARNFCLNILKGRRLDYVSYEELYPESFSDYVCDNLSSFYINKPDIMGKIKRLSKKKQKIITMLVEGYDYKEIAENEGITSGTVKAHVSESRKILKELCN